MAAPSSLPRRAVAGARALSTTARALSAVPPELLPRKTHTVDNQAFLWRGNAFTADHAMRVAVETLGASKEAGMLTSVGAWAGSEDTAREATAANTYGPQFRRYTRNGFETPVVDYHPAYHSLMRAGSEQGVTTHAWRAMAAAGGAAVPGAFVARGALAMLAYEAEAGTSCPLTMTFAGALPLAVAASGAGVGSPGAAMFGAWRDALTKPAYDPADAPLAEKAAATVGMSMTEKAGGSDVRAGSTFAAPLPAGAPGTAGAAAAPGELGAAYSLRGHRWFTSAPMSDAFLTLAVTDPAAGGYGPGGRGLSCFLVPRWLPDGSRNVGLRFMRLKDKCGDKSNASSEIEYDGAVGYLLSPLGRGVPCILDMVVSTRLDCAQGSAALMRQAVRLATFHATQRSVFGNLLLQQPAMQALLAELIVESRAAVWMALSVASLFDECTPAFAPLFAPAGSAAAAAAGKADPAALAEAQAFRRLTTAVAKYWVCKRTTGTVYEAMEAMGGNGYVTEWDMERHFRQSPLNSIWEGTGHLLALDVLRTFQKEPLAVTAFMKRVGKASAANPRLAAHFGRLQGLLKSAAAATEAEAQLHARFLTEQLALAFQGAAFARGAAADPEEAAAFDMWCALRLPPAAAGEVQAGGLRTSTLGGIAPGVVTHVAIKRIVEHEAATVKAAAQLPRVR